ncbi:MAG TPA: EAL domain-containing protein [Noviherbaspirillum sp.]|nr:EAL domain-containing protein [Noviherbaspirillum sp.]
MNKQSEHTQFSPHAEDEWLVDGGEMGKLVRSMDWSNSPLGPRESWPQSLRTTVNLCLASNFPIAIVWGPDRIQLYNDGYWPICGTKHPTSMGQDFWECWPTSRPAIGDAFNQAAAGQSAFIESQCVLLDRNGYLEETYFTFSFSPIHDEAGEVGGLFHPVTELTQQVVAERRLKALRAVADGTVNAHSIDEALKRLGSILARHSLDLPFFLLYAIDGQQKQAKLIEAIGLAPGTVASPERIELDEGSNDSWPLAVAIRAGKNIHIDALPPGIGPLHCGPYPEPIQAAMLLPLGVPGSAPLAVAVAGVSTRRALDEPYRTFYDMLTQGISAALANARAYEEERKRAAALAAIDEAKTAFFSNVSHEFRTPLALMLGPLEELLHTPAGVLARTDWHRVDIAHRNALRLLKLVNSLLDFSRIEAGRTHASFRSVDLAQYTGDLASMFRSVIEKAGIAYVVECEAMPQPVHVDTDLWEKIVLNLISNAFKFTFNGKIEVRLQWQDNGALLTVSDTGVGVPPEHLARLFERFHRVPNSRSRTFEGSGIGLALTQELVKIHGGTITAESVLNQGTTFSVFVPAGTAHLPADQVDARPPAAATAEDVRAFVEEARHWLPDANDPVEQRGGDIQPARILLADDNADMRNYVRRLLAQQWEVEAVADGMQALEAARRDPPDLVLTDIMMPNLDGFGLLRALRMDERTRATPVIMISARAGEESRVEGLGTGADDYLVKPFSARELLARVRTHLDIARMRQEAVASAQHDSLTGLPNRNLTLESANRLFSSARRHGKRVAVLFVDMDRFKPINDTYGHKAGDAVLKEVGQRLKSCVRAEDVVGRLGGDEFLAVLSHVQDAQDAGRAARHVIEALGRPYVVDGRELHSTPSIGIALFQDDGEDMEQLILNADVAMYHAKEKGRNNFQYFTKALNDQAARMQMLEADLRKGLARSEFQLYYQPVIDVENGTLAGVEALLRWPAKGLSPDRFIPVAESAGMIDELGSWIVLEACRQMREWREHALPPWVVSINVSPLQFNQAGLYDATLRALAEHEVAPGQLQLEVTESAMLKNKHDAIATARALKEAGVRIALDDFGKGYSNLSCLQLPLDAIKIDQSFIRSLASDTSSMLITEAIIGIGKALDVQVIAEGIESAQELNTLRGKDCRQMQGYFLCPPVPADRLEDWYRRWQGSPGELPAATLH